jgi:hypothetical protein
MEGFFFLVHILILDAALLQGQLSTQLEQLYQHIKACHIMTSLRYQHTYYLNKGRTREYAVED